MFDALRNFGLFDNVDSVDTRGRGLINRTYLVHAYNNRYVLQLIDTHVFKNVDKAIKNIELVTEHLKHKNDYDAFIIYSKDNRQHILVGDYYFRCYKLRDNEEIYQYYENDKIHYEIARILGRFHKLTADFDVKKLENTIPNFQNSYEQYKRFMKANEECKSDKYFYTFNEFKFINDRKNDFNLINNLLEKDLIPIRVTHNNVRKANIIFEKDTYNALYLIGFDAIMPGTLLRDFGDMARYAFNSTKENEKNLDAVYFRIDLFKEGLKAYLNEVKDIITPTEVKHLVDATKLMALEYGMRNLIEFLSDGKNFNPYCETDSWDICKNQFRLVQNIENNYDKLQEIVKEVAYDIMSLTI